MSHSGTVSVNLDDSLKAEMLEQLLGLHTTENFDKSTPLQSIVEKLMDLDTDGRNAMLDRFLTAGRDLNEQDVHEMTLLLYAAKCCECNIDLAELLIARGCRLDVEDIDGRGPLYYAAEHTDLSLLQKFIDCGASVNYTMKDGRSLLSLALEYNSTDLLQLLINNNVTMVIQEQGEETITDILQYAQNIACDDEIIEMLGGTALDSTAAEAE